MRDLQGMIFSFFGLLSYFYYFIHASCSAVGGSDGGSMFDPCALALPWRPTQDRCSIKPYPRMAKCIFFLSYAPELSSLDVSRHTAG
jgi:hypothetical protein